MAMVGVDSGSLYRRTHSLSRLAWSEIRRPLGAIYQMNWVNWVLAMALPWWQHFKHCLGLLVLLILFYFVVFSAFYLFITDNILAVQLFSPCHYRRVVKWSSFQFNLSDSRLSPAKSRCHIRQLLANSKPYLSARFNYEQQNKNKTNVKLH